MDGQTAGEAKQCQCDPPGSGEEFCTGHCYLRATIAALEAERDNALREAKHNSEGWDQALEIAAKHLEKREAAEAEREALKGDQYKQGFRDALAKVADDFASKGLRSQDTMQCVEIQAFLDTRHVHYEECRGAKPLQADLTRLRQAIRSLSYGELLRLTKGNGTSEIYERLRSATHEPAQAGGGEHG